MSLTGGLIPLGKKADVRRTNSLADENDFDDYLKQSDDQIGYGFDEEFEKLLDNKSNKTSKPSTKKTTNKRSSDIKLDNKVNKYSNNKDIYNEDYSNPISPASSFNDSPVKTKPYKTYNQPSSMLPTGDNLEDSILGNILGEPHRATKKKSPKIATASIYNDNSNKNDLINTLDMLPQMNQVLEPVASAIPSRRRRNIDVESTITVDPYVDPTNKAPQTTPTELIQVSNLSFHDNKSNSNIITNINANSFQSTNTNTNQSTKSNKVVFHDDNLFDDISFDDLLPMSNGSKNSTYGSSKDNERVLTTSPVNDIEEKDTVISNKGRSKVDMNTEVVTNENKTISNKFNTSIISADFNSTGKLNTNNDFKFNHTDSYSNKEVDRGSYKGKLDKEDNTDDVDIGFIPSFLDPDRKPRQKRSTNTSSTITSNFTSNYEPIKSNSKTSEGSHNVSSSLKNNGQSNNLSSIKLTISNDPISFSLEDSLDELDKSLGRISPNKLSMKPLPKISSSSALNTVSFPEKTDSEKDIVSENNNLNISDTNINKDSNVSNITLSNDRLVEPIIRNSAVVENYSTINHSNNSNINNSTTEIISSNVSNQSSTLQSNYRINTMQQRHEEVLLERDTRERQLRSEIESLRSQLASQATVNRSGPLTEDSLYHKAKAEQFSIENTKLTIERNQYKNIINDLELQIQRLKDEAIISSSKHKEDIRHLNEKNEIDLLELKKRKDEEIRIIENRHSDALSALKSIHSEEINAMKERSKDKTLLEQLTGQITSATGAIRYIEEQLTQKYHSIDAIKEGQLNARERVVKELEEQAKQRHASAETEGYKLQGVLIHLEHMSNSLQHQTMEEKLRLRNEIEKYQSLQKQLEIDRQISNERCFEELALLKDQQKQIDNDKQLLNKEKRLFIEQSNETKQQIETAKAELKQLVADHIKSSELTNQQLVIESNKLSQLKEELTNEKKNLESMRFQLHNEINSWESNKSKLIQWQDQLVKERNDLNAYRKQLEDISMLVNKKSEEINDQMESLVARENELQKGLKLMSIKTNELINKENYLSNYSFQLKQQENELVDKEKQLDVLTIQSYNKQLTIYNKISKQDTINKSKQLTLYSPPTNDQTNEPVTTTNELSWIENFKNQREKNENMLKLKHNSININSNSNINEINEAKRILIQSKLKLYTM